MASIDTLLFPKRNVSIDERVLISKLIESYDAIYHDMNDTSQGITRSATAAATASIRKWTCCTTGSVNKIITGARDSIKQQSRYLSVGALYRPAVSQSTRPVARASKTRTRSTLLSSRGGHNACARTVHIFFPPPPPPPRFLSVELSATEAIASPDEIFFPPPPPPPSPLSFSPRVRIPGGTDAKKYFAKMVEETTLSPDV